MDAVARIAQEHDLDPDDVFAAVFVDDMAADVEAAQNIGMHGVVVGPDPTLAMSELKALVRNLG